MSDSERKRMPTEEEHKAAIQALAMQPIKVVQSVHPRHLGTHQIWSEDGKSWLANTKCDDHVDDWGVIPNRWAACVNACRDIPNPAAIGRVVEAAKILLSIDDGDDPGLYGYEGQFSGLREALAALESPDEG